ncbi:MAG: O-antigen ligase family protein [Elusimicrobiota bacterium]|nr:O-antigen ligase family protein [Endomicrobiia bacterium]MDW8166665.1 O-antigen ligase family protein [Elusimicrobiota bacterium]
MYLKTKDVSFLLFIFLIGGIALQKRNFTYIKIGPIFITEFIMILLLLFIFTKLSISQNHIIIKGYHSNILAKFLVAYFMIGLIYLLGDLLSLDEVTLFECLRNFSLVYYSLFSLIVYFIFKTFTLEKIDKFFFTILLMNSLAGTVVIFMYIFNLETFIPKDGGIIGGPASLISAFASLISFHYIVSKENNKLIYIFLLLANSLFTFLSGHRSAYLALIIGLIVYLLLTRKIKIAVLLPLFISMFIVSLILLKQSQVLAESVIRIFGNIEELIYNKLSDPNAYWRYLYWNNVIQEVVSKPWGIGFDYSLSKLAPWEVWAERPSEIEFRSSVRLDPHNSYIAILARVGFVGFTVFVLIFAYYILFTYKMLRRLNNERKGYAILNLACFIAVATFAGFNVTLEGPYHGIFFWIFIGIGMAIYSQSNTK